MVTPTAAFGRWCWGWSQAERRTEAYKDEEHHKQAKPLVSSPGRVLPCPLAASCPPHGTCAGSLLQVYEAAKESVAEGSLVPLKAALDSGYGINATEVCGCALARRACPALLIRTATPARAVPGCADLSLRRPVRDN